MLFRSVEINPRLAAGPVLWADYQRSALTEILTRTTVSAATLAADKDGVARGAFGLQSVLYSAEARQAIDAASNGDCKAIADAYAASKDLPKSFGPGKLAEPPIELGSDVVAKCKARVSGLLTKWNPTSVSLGLGQALYSNTGSARKLKSGSSVAWITGTVGFDGNTGDAVEDRMGVGLTAHVRRSLHERVASPSDATMLVDESSTLYGLNVRGGNRKFGALFETSLRRAKATSLLDEKRRRYFLGVEYRLREDLYLVAGVGSDKGRRDGKEDRATLVNLKWGFSEQSVLRKP